MSPPIFCCLCLAYLLKGMFLYARIMLGNIELLSDIEDIRKELRVLPENLNEAYVTE